MGITTYISGKFINPIYYKLRDPGVWELVTMLKKYQYSDPDLIKKRQWESLIRLLHHAKNFVPYYRDILKRGELEIDGKFQYEDFVTIPVLTKQNIQMHFHQLKSTKKYDGIYENYSGGSTGKPTKFLQDKQYHIWNTATAFWSDSLSGWDFGHKKALLWGAERDIEDERKSIRFRLRNQLIYRHLYLNSFKMNENRMKLFTLKLKKYRPKYLLGYANSLDAYSQYLKKYDIDMSPVGIKAVISSAETLTDDSRRNFQNIFKAPVFNRYGSRETGAIATECEIHSGLHTNASHVFVEILDPMNKPVKSGEKGEIVITLLNNYSMPLIRYKMGDLARASSTNQCDCGRGFPLISSVEGRVTDVFIFKNGRQVHGEFFTHLFYNRDGVSCFQVRQDIIDILDIFLETNSTYNNKIEEEIKNEIRSFVELKLQIRFHHVDEIPLTSTGKRLFTISTITS